MSSNSVQNFLSNPADKDTNKQIHVIFSIQAAAADSTNYGSFPRKSYASI